MEKTRSILSFLFAVALQIQITLFQTANYNGLRISLADLLLPIGFLIVRRFELQKPFGWWAIISMTLAVTYSMINGYFIQGEISHWALINKFAGWFILMGYFAIGASLNREVFFKTFVAFFILLAFKEVLILDEGYIDGLMANRNAYAFMLVCVLVLATVRNYTPLVYILWTLLPILVLLNASRTLWLCIPFLILFLTLNNWRQILRLSPCLLLGVTVFVLIAGDKERGLAHTPLRSMIALYKHTDLPQQKHFQASGDPLRLSILESSMDLIRQYPWGTGLGTHLKAQEGGIVIDSTPLWILTEMGPIGLTAFLAAFMAIVGTIKLNREALLIIFCFMVFCLFHEITYTRFLWVFLGLYLVKKPELKK